MNNKQDSLMLGSLKSSQATESDQLTEYSYRFLIVAMFSFASFVNGMCWVIVSPISVQVAQAYDVSPGIVSIIPLSYMAVYLFINFPSNWVLDEKGIKKSMVMGAVLTTLGCGLRCLINQSFWFVILGQVFCAIAQPFILNAPTKIAVRWFMPRNRSVALAVLAVINIIGTAVGFLVPPLFVDSDAANYEIRDGFFTLLLFYLFLSILPAFFIIVFFKEKPPTLPSLGSMAQNTPFKESIKSIFTNKKTLSLIFSFGTVLGSFNIYGSLLDNILDPYGFDNDQVSYLAATMMGTGILSAGLFGAYIQKTLKYHRVFRVLGIVGVIQCVLLPFYLKYFFDNHYLAFPLIICQGIVFIPLMPLSFDYTCDIMFPIGEAQITGILMSSGQLFGVIFVLISQQIFNLGDKGNSNEQNKDAALYTTIVVGATCAVGVFFYCFYNSQLKRSKLQRKEIN